MSSRNVDRNLLFGFLALQNNFITREELIAAVSVWLTDKEQSLVDILQQRRSLSESQLLLVRALTQEHLKQHGDDAEKSLAALSSVGNVRDDLKRLGDSEIESSLIHVSKAAAGASADPFATLQGSDESALEKTRFRILRPHAEGGLGQVFVACDEELNREVALKEIKFDHAHNTESRARFLLEAEITGGLEHPGIVPVYGLGQYADGRPFYAMRFIRGDSLAEAIARFHAKKPGREAYDGVEFRGLLSRFIDVCNAIEYAHSRGVLHRDLKPGNIMLGKYGETLVVDWGLAKAQGRAEQHEGSGEFTLQPRTASGSSATQMGAAIGTPAYMSPEQAAGRLDRLGPPADVYSLGATLYTILTGQAPFDKNEDVGVLLRKVQAGDFAAPRARNPFIRNSLEAICLKALHLNPNERYASPKKLAEDMEHYLADEPVSVVANWSGARLARWLRKNRGVAATLAMSLVLFCVVVTIGIFAVNHQRALTEEARQGEAQRAAAEKEQRELAVKREAEQKAITRFYENHVLAAARPKGWAGGIGKDVTLKDAVYQAIPNISKAFPAEPELEASVQHTLGATFYYLGQYDDAITALDRALSIRKKLFGNLHADTLASLHELAMVRWKQDRLSEAIPLIREAFEGRRKVLGSEHEDTLFSQLNLGLFLSEDGQRPEAEKILREGIEISKRALGTDHHHTLYGQNDLAVLLSNQGKYDDALILDRETLEARRRALGPDHPDTLRSVANTACDLWFLDRLPEAEAMCREGLDGRKRILGDAHTETFWSLRNLCGILDAQGKYKEAENLYRQTLEDSERLRGPDDSETLINMSHWANFLRSRGKLDGAVEIYRKLINANKRVFGTEHSNTLSSEHNLAWALGLLEKFDECEALYRQILATRLRIQGPDHRDTLISQHSLAWALKMRGNLQETIELYRKVLEAEIRIHGADEPNTLVTQSNLALALEDAGQLEEAELLLRQIVENDSRARGSEHTNSLHSKAALAGFIRDHKSLAEAETLFREVLEAYRRVSGPTHPSTLNMQNSLAIVLAKSKKCDEAEKLLREALAYRRKTSGGDAEAIAVDLIELGNLLTATDRAQEAEPLVREALTIREKILPDQHWRVANARSGLGYCLTELSRFEEAEKLLLLACNVFASSKSAPKERVAEAFDRIVALYKKWDKPEQAEEWQKKRPAIKP